MLCNSTSTFAEEQKGSLQEKIEFAGHHVTFYPKFHCELNFIERFWCTAKHYVRENCVYTLDGLRQTIPASFKSISTASINRLYRICSWVIDAYTHGYRYGTKKFVDHAYKSHRQVVDKSKW
jgi:transposase